MQGKSPAPGVDAFWLDAEANECSDHPLERELCHRLEAVERYRRMIDEAQEGGLDDDAIEALITQQSRQAKLVRELQDALRRYQTPSSPA